MNKLERRTKLIDKVCEQLGLTRLHPDKLKETKTTINLMVKQKEIKNEQVFIYLMETLFMNLGFDKLSEKENLELRQTFNKTCEVLVEADKPKVDETINELENLSGKNLLKHYFQNENNTSSVKTLDKKLWKFNEPEQDISDVLQIKKSEFRFESDKENIMGGLR